MSENMDCLKCGHEFEGWIGDDCPKCEASNVHVVDKSEDLSKFEIVKS